MSKPELSAIGAPVDNDDRGALPAWDGSAAAAGAEHATHLAFWRQHLDGAPALINLPYDRARPAAPSGRAGHVEFALSSELTARVRALGERQGATLSAVLLSGWAILLSRLSGQDDLVVGTRMVDTRSAGEGAQPRPGADALALRIRTSPESTGAQLLAQVQATLLAAVSHRDLPFAKVLEVLHPERDPAQAPAFQVVLALNDDAPLEAHRCDLCLELAESGDGVSGRLRYASDLFDPMTAERFAAYFDAVLAAIGRDEHQPLGQILLANQAQALAATALAAARPIPEGPLHRLFEAEAARRPDAAAVAGAGERWSYRVLNEHANRWALRLREAGVRPGDRVALCAGRTPSMVAGLLAILKAGAAYLPLDPDYPRDRLARVLDAGQPAAWVVSPDLLAALPAPTVPVVHLTADDSGPACNLDLPGIDGDSLAYVIFTSGSTGVPKGVAMPQRALVNLIAWQRATDGVPEPVTLQFAALGFDVAAQEILSTLCVGGELVLADETSRHDPAELLRLLARHRIQRLFLPTAALQGLAVAAEAAPPALPDLRHVFVAGESLRIGAAKSFFARLPHCRLHNQYGPTETHVVTAHTLPADTGVWPALPPIGRPVDNCRIYVLDGQGHPLPPGVVGEIYIGGAGVAQGYLHRPELTFERFLPDPFADDAAARMYRTGDLGRWRADGQLDCLGRNDFQVKIRGFRIELGEVEACVLKIPGVREASVQVREDLPGEKRLVAYVVGDVDTVVLRGAVAASLPPHMVPSAWVRIDALPLTVNRKVDKKALPPPSRQRPMLGVPYQAPGSLPQRAVCETFEAVLALEGVGIDDNFFELGGSSLLVLQLVDRLAERLGHRVSPASVFAQPTPRGLADAIAATTAASEAPPAPVTASPAAGRDIAIIGMAGRFPGAASVEAFWQNLLAGRDGTTDFTLETLDASVPAGLRDDPAYVRSRGVIDGVEWFDAAFFGIPAREAELIDPQQRLFLEAAWECLESAGHAPGATRDRIGVYAGVNTPSYLQHHVMAHPDAMERAGNLAVSFANDKDYVALRVAHKLGLTGPALCVNTACSTSLVAVAQAVDSLRLGRCEMALAGGASVTSPSRSGYLYQEGSMLSSDARTRTFDASAQGTSFNDGVAVVLLKPLERALADGDTVYAVIRGAALNNDGGDKASFSAPSVEGQATVIAAAQADAGVDARSIGYVEAHGTATPLGDPIEVEALTRAFRRHTADRQYCGIGSAKSNVGHLVTAAGAAGLIKTALALHTQQLPASIGYERPNPHIDFDASPFFVVDRARPWPRGDAPRRAGVSSFGVGGTNAHVVVEEAPLRAERAQRDAGPQVLRLSARTPSALQAMALRLADRLEADGGLELADVAHTLDVGRSRFEHRLGVAAADRAQAVQALRQADSADCVARRLPAAQPEWVWMFPGQGAQYAGMGGELYVAEPAFRAAFDACVAAFEAHLPFDLADALLKPEAPELQATAAVQPALFTVEYALAQAWLARGAAPAALIGHSIGEWVAAVLAGVMSLADAARLVALRGALMQVQAPGRMMAVRMPLADVQAQLPPALSLAAENGPMACVVAGPSAAIDAWRTELEAAGRMCRVLATSHAFHSPMMDPALAPLESALRGVVLSAPAIPIVSTLTGKWLRADEATDPAYWARQMREPVRFSQAVRTALDGRPAAFLEVGPRGALTTLARQHGAGGTVPIAAASLAATPAAERHAYALAQAALWTAGVELARKPAPDARRVSLPTYPFERQRHWLEPRAATAAVRAAAADQLSSSSSSQVMPMSTSAATPGRPARYIDQLRVLLQDVTGSDFSQVDPAASFLDMGLDSLTLTQAALQIKRAFRVNVTFRQLMESYRSLADVAQYLDATVPAEAPTPAPAVAPAVAAAPVAAAAAPVAAPVFAAPVASALPSDGLHGLILQQMQLMSQQLALLSGAAPAAAAMPAPVPAPAPAVVPVAAAAALPAASAPAARTEAVEPVRYDVKKAFGAIARIHTSGHEFTERQQARLAAFIRRYTDKTRKSKEYTVQHRAHLADPRVVNGFRPATKELVYQIVMPKSKGSRMWDLDGNEYVDALNGFGMSMFGWQPDFVLDAVRAQIDDGYDIGPMHPLAGDVARLICELTGMDRAGLCNTGSEAVMAAIRIARTVTGRNTMVLFSGSYHGTFDEVLVRGGANGKGLPAAPGVLAGAFGDVRVLEYGSPQALEFIRDNADDLAAVLVEPVQSRRPDFQPKEFLREVRAITEKSGTCLIFDEVITGFRSHPGGVQALFDIRADLATYGKVIGGGFPVGVVAGKREFMDALDGGSWQYGDASMPTVGVTYFAGTFVRHPLALAACKVSLEHLKQQGAALQTALNTSTAAMADELNAHCRSVGAPVQINHFASLWRVAFQADHPMQDLLFAMMRNRGVHILDNFPCFLTTAHTPDDIAIIKTAFRESIAEMQEAEFLPRQAAAAAVVDASRPPVPNARLGRDKDGKAAWFVPDPASPAKFKKVDL